MFVKDEIFYHIHRLNHFSSLWSPGNHIDITNRQPNAFNAFYAHYHRFYTVNGQQFLPNQVSSLVLSTGDALTRENLWGVFLFNKQVIEDYAIYLRERVFEDVRQQYFPNLPSRRTGIWVFSEDAKEYWKTELKGERKIFKVCLTGVIHKADQRHLIAEVLPENVLRQRAFYYWTGNDGTNPIEEELLFEGIVKVLDECAS